MIGACAVGFGGTLMIIQPSFSRRRLASAATASCRLSFRLTGADDEADRQGLRSDLPPGRSGLTSTVMLLGLWLALHDLGMADLQITGVTGLQTICLVLIGLFGTLSHLSMNYAVRFAPSATLAPMQYIELPIATSIGWLIFGELPNSLAALGITLSVASGLAVIYFEHRALTRKLGSSPESTSQA